MKRICIIGMGNVATHMCVALADKADELIIVSSRTLEDLPSDSDLYLLAVSDDAIVEVAQRLPQLAGVLAHTSGSVPMEVLAPYADRYGVLYPLQTFTRGAELDYNEIPVFVEGSDSGTEQELQEAAALFSQHVDRADSLRRRRLHIASVFACNYVNHMWHIADTILKDDNLSLAVLQPLIKATVAKIRQIPPEEAQTGPASRGDTGTIATHLAMLQDSPVAELYKLLADSIMHTSTKKTMT